MDAAKFDALTAIRAWLDLACPETAANGLALKPLELWYLSDSSWLDVPEEDAQ